MKIWNWNEKNGELELGENAGVGTSVRVLYNYARNVDGVDVFSSGRLPYGSSKENVVKLSPPGNIGEAGKITAILPAGTSAGTVSERGRKRNFDGIEVTFDRTIYNPKTRQDEKVRVVVDPRALATLEGFEAAMTHKTLLEQKENAALMRRFLPKNQRFTDLSSSQLTGLIVDLNKALEVTKARKVELDLESTVSQETASEEEAVTLADATEALVA